MLPFVHDVNTNITQLADRRDLTPPPSAIAAASMQLKRFAEYGANQSECSLFPAVRDLLANFTLPSEPPVISQVIISIRRNLSMLIIKLLDYARNENQMTFFPFSLLYDIEIN